MKCCSRQYRGLEGLFLVIMLTILPLRPIPGQWPFSVPTTPQSQRSALGNVRAEVNWVQNATRAASSYGPQGFGNVWQTFQGLRQAYSVFKSTLNPRQLANGANQWAELDAGLDIIQEAFANYQDDLAAGRPGGPALRDMCRGVREGCGLWLEELNKTCTVLKVGWGS
jgi:hypothetical protein